MCINLFTKGIQYGCPASVVNSTLTYSLWLHSKKQWVTGFDVSFTWKWVYLSQPFQSATSWGLSKPREEHVHLVISRRNGSRWNGSRQIGTNSLEVWNVVMRERPVICGSLAVRLTLKVILGFHPNSLAALEASPCKKSWRVRITHIMAATDLVGTSHH